MTTTRDTAEHRRLAEATGRAEDGLFDANPWYEWGPYLAERAWGTVREDYSADGNAWASFPHDHARSRAYRWNEDGMAGISDIRHELCMALALWNGADPILKERMFGLTGPEGNHGEDVKECWWYTEGLPSHALLRWRYHYPQAPFPYADLVAENGRRGKLDPEYELIDTGVFDDGRFWIVEVTYAKVSPTEILCQIDIENHGPDEAVLDVLPTLWFHNSWRWADSPDIPALRLDGDAVTVHHPRLEGYRLEAAPGADGAAPMALFCDNETNTVRLYGGEPITPYPKDGINDHVIAGAATVNPDADRDQGRLVVPVHRPRRRSHAAAAAPPPARHARDGDGDRRRPRPPPRLRRRRPGQARPSRRPSIAARPRRTSSTGRSPPGRLDEERMRILRQASAGLVWSKQFYPYRVGQWLDGDPGQPPPPAGHAAGRNAGWRHLDAFDVLAMPDPWEYPWFAAWDLAFHAVAWAHLDPAFAKYQLIVMLREWFQHPNGALPAYEWNFDDVNPPVHAIAAARVFLIDGGTDTDFLERVFGKLLLNFTWWLNRAGSRRQQHLRRRVPGARQHQPDRPVRAPSGCPAGAGGRDGVDGRVRPEHARDRAAAGRDPAGLRGHGRQVRRAVPDDRGRHRGGRPAGPGGRLVLRPSRRTRRGDLSYGSRHSSVPSRSCRRRSSGSPTRPPPVASGTASTGSSRRDSTRPEPSPGTSATTSSETGSCCPWSGPRSCGMPWRRSSTRMRSSRRTGSARSRSGTRCRTRYRGFPRPGSSTNRPRDARTCTGATPTGAVPSGCRSTS